MTPKRIAGVILAGLFLYLTLFTWNQRTGHLDSLTGYTGLEFVGLVLKPGKWIDRFSSGFWDRYVYLVGVREQLDQSREECDRLKLEKAQLQEKAALAERLETFLSFTPPPAWYKEGARVIGQRLGPAALLETILVDKGKAHGVEEDTPVMAPKGLLGRVLRVSPTSATVLLLTDPNSKIAVMGQKKRFAGILAGQGRETPLSLRYVNVNALFEEGELLITSGLDKIFPKGLPVARVKSVARAEGSSPVVTAELVAEASSMEEVMLLRRDAELDEDEED